MVCGTNVFSIVDLWKSRELGSREEGVRAATRHTPAEADMRLDVRALSLTCGFLGGLGLFCLTWWIIAFDGVTGDPTIIGRIYRGYTVSPEGSLIGLIWGFVDWMVGGAVCGWVYNTLAERVVFRA